MEEKNALIIFFNDVSDKIYHERILMINAYKEEMLSSISHNLKTPLNAIMLYVEILHLNLCKLLI